MLVFSHRIGGTLMIGDNVEVKILGISGNQVRLAVVAPKQVAVDRAEIRELKDAGQPAPLREASAATPVVPKRPRITTIRSRLYGRSLAD